MNLPVKILLPLIVIVSSLVVSKVIVNSRPEASTRPSFDRVQAVEATRLTRSSYQVVIRTQGTVKPSRESSLVPEVTGIIKTISPNFVIGGYFAKDELLIEIDRRDYEIALLQANAQYAQSSAVLQEEQARAKQAIVEWKSIGRKGKPSGLTARVPQLAAARADLAAARAQIKKAELDLERTRIIAPYAGRVMEKQVDEGEFVSRGATLGRVYSIDLAEVRLPLSNRQLTHLAIPGAGGAAGAVDTGAADSGQPVTAEVLLKANIGGADVSWPARLIRSEGVDTASQQLNVIAEVQDPFAPENGMPPLRIGQFVNGEVNGDVLEGVFVLPRAALREDREVLLLDNENKVMKRLVDVAWTDDSVVAVSAGLEDGDVLILTTLGAVTEGTRLSATIDGVAPPPRQQGKPGQKGPGKKDATTGPQADSKQRKQKLDKSANPET